MKRYLTLIMAFMVLVSVSAQTDAEYAEVEKVVSEIRAACPLQAGENISITDVELDSGVMTWRYSMRDFGAIQRTSEENFMESIMTNLPVMVATNPALEPLFRSLVKLGITFRIIFKSEITGKVISGDITPERMTSVLDAAPDADQSLRMIVDNSCRTLPITVSRGLRMVKKELTDKALVTVFEVDDTILNFSNLENGREKMYQAVVEMTKNRQDPPTLFEMRACVMSGRGYTLLYRAKTSQRELPLNFAPEVLRELLGL